MAKIHMAKIKCIELVRKSVVWDWKEWLREDVFKAYLAARPAYDPKMRMLHLQSTPENWELETMFLEWTILGFYNQLFDTPGAQE